MAILFSKLTETTGSEIAASKEELLTPETGRQLRDLLIERGVLVMRGLFATDEEQVALAQSMGRLRPEGENGIAKITLDKNTRAAADYLKGSFLWHMDGTHDRVPRFRLAPVSPKAVRRGRTDDVRQQLCGL